MNPTPFDRYSKLNNKHYRYVVALGILFIYLDGHLKAAYDYNKFAGDEHLIKDCEIKGLTNFHDE